MNLRNRSNEPELMDSEGGEEELRSALGELKKINRFLGGNSVSSSGLKEIKRKFKLQHISMLDAGSGASDIIPVNKLSAVNITALDKNKIICSMVKKEKQLDAVCGDASRSPFREKSFDVVHASLFLHHFNETQIPVLLKQFFTAAKFGVVINDLQRSYLAYYGFKLVALIFLRNRLVRHDGALSVRRGFIKKELKSILNNTGYEYKLERKWAFRWLIVIYLNERI